MNNNNNNNYTMNNIEKTLNGKNDLRKEKTRNALKEAFVSLLYKQSIEKITINQICAKANINRITFYNHYEDKYDLFNSILIDGKDKVAERLNTELNKSTINEDILGALMKFVEAVSDICLENKDLLLAIVRDEENSIIEYILKSYVENSINEIMVFLNIEKMTNLSLPLLSSYVTGGICSLIFYWLSHQNEFTKVDFLKFVHIIIGDTIEKYYPKKKISNQ